MMEAGCQCTMQNRNNVSYAGAGVRFCAYIIDQLILLMVIAILAGVFGILGLFGLDKILEYKLLFHFTVSAIIYFIVKKIYFVAFTYTSGQTVGKKLFRIKVVSEDMSKASFWSVLYREVIGRYLCGLKEFVWVGYLIMLLDNEKRGAHDRLSDTRVVYDEEINNEEENEEMFVKEGQNYTFESFGAQESSSDEDEFIKAREDMYDLEKDDLKETKEVEDVLEIKEDVSETEEIEQIEE